MQAREQSPNLIQLAWIFLRLGCTSFGGPAAHLGYFRAEFVQKRVWLTEEAYANLVALCQFLPGPTSSQVGFALGLQQKGLIGALIAWVGFTAPSALLMYALATEILADSATYQGVVAGLHLVAFAVVAQAVWAMARQFCLDRPRRWMLLVTTLTLWLIQIHPLILLAGMGLWGIWIYQEHQETKKSTRLALHIPKLGAQLALGLFFCLLLALPWLTQTFAVQELQIFNAFYYAGTWVFGGGHVVLPMLESQVVETGWISEQTFLTGYAGAQAMPGPLFSFAAFVGTHLQGIQGGFIALFAIFLPSFLLLYGILPYWQILQKNALVQAALMGINVGVVGILLAALYDPIFTHAINTSRELALGVIFFLLLHFNQISPLSLVILGAGIGYLVL
ncbi:chromate transporter [Allopseudospirillum japonicum]|uniref:Chromate transporter n=1 Tax=Allopseudospirillum japonicum TaxID=64971 RepID=A0A1H6QD88_9GAMM|nr:chromate efflux transporter [Allopseudospirillum japonicum]SEI39836.1 chromate transporter [Allopseudospirillum japonicum]